MIPAQHENNDKQDSGISTGTNSDVSTLRRDSATLDSEVALKSRRKESYLEEIFERGVSPAAKK